MTEYGDAYNWEKTWLNAAPLERAILRQSPEPHFQHKRHFEQSDSYNLWGPEHQAKEITEDPFFIIHGRNHKKFAYPNILYRRAKSAPRERRNSLTQNEDMSIPQRPKSDGAAEAKKPIRSSSKNQHSKSRSRSKGPKKPIERWPELKMDIPSDSPRLTKRSEYQRSSSPSLADVHKKVRPQSSKSQAPKSKPKPSSSSLDEKKTSFNLEERLSQRSKFEAMSKDPILESGSSKPEFRQKLQSEYQANYRDLSDFTSVAKIQNNEARQNQLQVEGCHFSQSHFNQLDSVNVNFWDPLYSTQSEVVGITPTEMTKRLKEYKATLPRRQIDTTLSDRGFRIPRYTPKLSSKYPSVSLSAHYEPSKYVNRTSKDEEQRIKILPYEGPSDFGCTQSHHYCNRGGNFLVSKVRPDEVTLPFPTSSARYECVPPASPMSLSSSLSLAEQTLDRALRRRNKLLVSTCRE
ncbi:hypothetical protein Aperf_G00000099754 [Anoplocephala perfoliata]